MKIKLFEEINEYDPFDEEDWDEGRGSGGVYDLINKILSYLLDNTNQIKGKTYKHVLVFSYKSIRYSIHKKYARDDSKILVLNKSGLADTDSIHTQLTDDLDTKFIQCIEIANEKHNNKINGSENLLKFKDYFNDL